MTNTTTLARGWKLTRADGQVMAFTDCDVDLEVEGVTYLASAALTPSEATQALGAQVDEIEVTGALSSATISEADLAAGLYDGALVEVIEIDWATSAKTETVGRFTIGEVTRDNAAFSAELRSEAGLLAQRRGRYAIPTCDAELGDTRCGVDVSGMSGTGTVVTTTGPADFRVSAPWNAASGTFTAGTLVWTSGANLGQSQEVRSHIAGEIALWRAPLFDITAGDTFDIQPGCDKSFPTCRDRYANAVNFRGCPHITGEAVLQYAVPGEAGLDGGSRNG